MNVGQVGGAQNPVQELASPLALAPGLQGPPGSAKKTKTPKTPGEPRSKLRTEGGYLSVYDIINLVLEKEPGSDARDRFKGYRDGDKKLLDLPRIAFSGKHESPALSKWDELEALLKHVQDPAKVLKFRLTYKKDLEAVLGPEPATNAANLAAFGLLQGNYCPGQGGNPDSYIASLPNLGAFLAFKRSLEYETVTVYSAWMTSRRSEFLYVKYRCNPKLKVKCAARIIARIPYAEASERPPPPKQAIAAPKEEVPAVINVNELSLERGPITVELEVGHEGHVPGSAADVEALPVDDRVSDRLKELAKEGHDWKSIQQQLHALGGAIVQQEAAHDAAQNAKRFFPDEKTIKAQLVVEGRKQRDEISKAAQHWSKFRAHLSLLHAWSVLAPKETARTALARVEDIVAFLQPHLENVQGAPLQGQDSLAPGLVHEPQAKPKKRKGDGDAGGGAKKRGRKKKEEEVKIDVNTLPHMHDDVQISEAQSNQWV
ncbi:hypothetical protein KFL_007060010 [Klebsormidium nitens]|uniref:Uncharacterized protein n=1 Tax=Klebsormidium nitens TaxID=105231 RepID=A0A1Y1IJI6_KLENI|nr:hypothetical protein KFL_007060010 [Klebsormidium nitens]|eukprot:GAQ90944.1 hypothetical protein KFL_007060010 [Klebsormidium nitens]